MFSQLNTQRSSISKNLGYHRRQRGRIANLPWINELLLRTHDDGPRPHMSERLTIAIKRYITLVYKHEKKTPEFVSEVRSKLLCLHEYNMQIAKVTCKYPKSDKLDELLVQYIKLECDQTCYREDQIRRSILSLVQMIQYDAMNVVQDSGPAMLDDDWSNARMRSKNDYLKETLKIFATAKKEWLREERGHQDLIDSIIIELVNKLGLLDDLNNLKGKNIPYHSDTYLKDPDVTKIRQNLVTSDYESDSRNSNNDGEPMSPSFRISFEFTDTLPMPFSTTRPPSERNNKSNNNNTTSHRKSLTNRNGTKRRFNHRPIIDLIKSESDSEETMENSSIANSTTTTTSSKEIALPTIDGATVDNSSRQSGDNNLRNDTELQTRLGSSSPEIDSGLNSLLSSNLAEFGPSSRISPALFSDNTNNVTEEGDASSRISERDAPLDVILVERCTNRTAEFVGYSQITETSLNNNNAVDNNDKDRSIGFTNGFHSPDMAPSSAANKENTRPLNPELVTIEILDDDEPHDYRVYVNNRTTDGASNAGVILEDDSSKTMINHKPMRLLTPIEIKNERSDENSSPKFPLLPIDGDRNAGDLCSGRNNQSSSSNGGTYTGFNGKSGNQENVDRMETLTESNDVEASQIVSTSADQSESAQEIPSDVDPVRKSISRNKSDVLKMDVANIHVVNSEVPVERDAQKDAQPIKSSLDQLLQQEIASTPQSPVLETPVLEKCCQIPRLTESNIEKFSHDCETKTAAVITGERRDSDSCKTLNIDKDRDIVPNENQSEVGLKEKDLCVEPYHQDSAIESQTDVSTEKSSEFRRIDDNTEVSSVERYLEPKKSSKFQSIDDISVVQSVEHCSRPEKSSEFQSIHKNIEMPCVELRLEPVSREEKASSDDRLAEIRCPAKLRSDVHDIEKSFESLNIGHQELRNSLTTDSDTSMGRQVEPQSTDGHCIDNNQNIQTGTENAGQIGEPSVFHSAVNYTDSSLQIVDDKASDDSPVEKSLESQSIDPSADIQNQSGEERCLVDATAESITQTEKPLVPQKIEGLEISHTKTDKTKTRDVQNKRSTKVMENLGRNNKTKARKTDRSSTNKDVEEFLKVDRKKSYNLRRRKLTFDPGQDKPSTTEPAPQTYFAPSIQMVTSKTTDNDKLRNQIEKFDQFEEESSKKLTTEAEATDLSIAQQEEHTDLRSAKAQSSISVDPEQQAGKDVVMEQRTRGEGLETRDLKKDVVETSETQPSSVSLDEGHTLQNAVFQESSSQIHLAASNENTVQETSLEIDHHGDRAEGTDTLSSIQNLPSIISEDYGLESSEQRDSEHQTEKVPKMRQPTRDLETQDVTKLIKNEVDNNESIPSEQLTVPLGKEQVLEIALCQKGDAQIRLTAASEKAIQENSLENDHLRYRTVGIVQHLPSIISGECASKSSEQSSQVGRDSEHQAETDSETRQTSRDLETQDITKLIEDVVDDSETISSQQSTVPLDEEQALENALCQQGDSQISSTAASEKAKQDSFLGNDHLGDRAEGLRKVSSIQPLPSTISEDCVLDSSERTSKVSDGWEHLAEEDSKPKRRPRRKHSTVSEKVARRDRAGNDHLGDRAGGIEDMPPVRPVPPIISGDCASESSEQSSQVGRDSEHQAETDSKTRQTSRDLETQDITKLIEDVVDDSETISSQQSTVPLDEEQASESALCQEGDAQISLTAVSEKAKQDSFLENDHLGDRAEGLGKVSSIQPLPSTISEDCVLESSVRSSKVSDGSEHQAKEDSKPKRRPRRKHSTVSEKAARKDRAGNDHLGDRAGGIEDVPSVQPVPSIISGDCASKSTEENSKVDGDSEHLAEKDPKMTRTMSRDLETDIPKSVKDVVDSSETISPQHLSVPLDKEQTLDNEMCQESERLTVACENAVREDSAGTDHLGDKAGDTENLSSVQPLPSIISEDHIASASCEESSKQGDPERQAQTLDEGQALENVLCQQSDAQLNSKTASGNSVRKSPVENDLLGDRTEKTESLSSAKSSPSVISEDCDSKNSGDSLLPRKDETVLTIQSPSSTVCEDDVQPNRDQFSRTLAAPSAVLDSSQIDSSYQNSTHLSSALPNIKENTDSVNDNQPKIEPVERNSKETTEQAVLESDFTSRSSNPEESSIPQIEAEDNCEKIMELDVGNKERSNEATETTCVLDTATLSVCTNKVRGTDTICAKTCLPEEAPAIGDDSSDKIESATNSLENHNDRLDDNSSTVQDSDHLNDGAPHVIAKSGMSAVSLPEEAQISSDVFLPPVLQNIPTAFCNEDIAKDSEKCDQTVDISIVGEQKLIEKVEKLKLVQTLPESDVLETQKSGNSNDSHDAPKAPTALSQEKLQDTFEDPKIAKTASESEKLDGCEMKEPVFMENGGVETEILDNACKSSHEAIGSDHTADDTRMERDEHVSMKSLHSETEPADVNYEANVESDEATRRQNETEPANINIKANVESDEVNNEEELRADENLSIDKVELGTANVCVEAVVEPVEVNNQKGLELAEESILIEANNANSGELAEKEQNISVKEISGEAPDANLSTTDRVELVSSEEVNSGSVVTYPHDIETHDIVQTETGRNEQEGESINNELNNAEGANLVENIEVKTEVESEAENNQAFDTYVEEEEGMKQESIVTGTSDHNENQNATGTYQSDEINSESVKEVEHSSMQEPIGTVEEHRNSKGLMTDLNITGSKATDVVSHVEDKLIDDIENLHIAQTDDDQMKEPEERLPDEISPVHTAWHPDFGSVETIDENDTPHVIEETILDESGCPISPTKTDRSPSIQLDHCVDMDLRYSVDSVEKLERHQKHPVSGDEQAQNFNSTAVDQESSGAVALEKVTDIEPSYSTSDGAPYVDVDRKKGLDLLADLAADQETLPVKTDSESRSRAKMALKKSPLKKSRVKFSPKKSTTAGGRTTGRKKKKATQPVVTEVRVTRSSTRIAESNRSQVEYKPHDFISMQNSSLKKIVYAQGRLHNDHQHVSSDDSNDSCGGMVIDESGYKLQEPAASPQKDDDLLEASPTIMGSTSDELQKPVTLTGIDDQKNDALPEVLQEPVPTVSTDDRVKFEKQEEAATTTSVYQQTSDGAVKIEATEVKNVRAKKARKGTSKAPVKDKEIIVVDVSLKEPPGSDKLDKSIVVDDVQSKETSMPISLNTEIITDEAGTSQSTSELVTLDEDIVKSSDSTVQFPSGSSVKAKNNRKTASTKKRARTKSTSKSSKRSSKSAAVTTPDNDVDSSKQGTSAASSTTDRTTEANKVPKNTTDHSIERILNTPSTSGVCKKIDFSLTPNKDAINTDTTVLANGMLLPDEPVNLSNPIVVETEPFIDNSDCQSMTKQMLQFRSKGARKSYELQPTLSEANVSAENSLEPTYPPRKKTQVLMPARWRSKSINFEYSTTEDGELLIKQSTSGSYCTQTKEDSRSNPDNNGSNAQVSAASEVGMLHASSADETQKDHNESSITGTQVSSPNRRFSESDFQGAAVETDPNSKSPMDKTAKETNEQPEVILADQTLSTVEGRTHLSVQPVREICIKDSSSKTDGNITDRIGLESDRAKTQILNLARGSTSSSDEPVANDSTIRASLIAASDEKSTAKRLGKKRLILEQSENSIRLNFKPADAIEKNDLPQDLSKESPAVINQGSVEKTPLKEKKVVESVATNKPKVSSPKKALKNKKDKVISLEDTIKKVKEQLSTIEGVNFDEFSIVDSDPMKSKVNTPEEHDAIEGIKSRDNQVLETNVNLSNVIIDENNKEQQKVCVEEPSELDDFNRNVVARKRTKKKIDLGDVQKDIVVEETQEREAETKSNKKTDTSDKQENTVLEELRQLESNSDVKNNRSASTDKRNDIIVDETLPVEDFSKKISPKRKTKKKLEFCNQQLETVLGKSTKRESVGTRKKVSSTNKFQKKNFILNHQTDIAVDEAPQLKESGAKIEPKKTSTNRTASSVPAEDIFVEPTPEIEDFGEKIDLKRKSKKKAGSIDQPLEVVVEKHDGVSKKTEQSIKSDSSCLQQDSVVEETIRVKNSAKKIDSKTKSKKKAQSSDKLEDIVVAETPVKEPAETPVKEPADKSDFSHEQNTDVERTRSKSSDRKTEPKSKSKKRTQHSDHQEDVAEETLKKADASKKVRPSNRSGQDVDETQAKDSEKKVASKNKSKRGTQSSEQLDVVVEETPKNKDASAGVGSANKFDLNPQQQEIGVEKATTKHSERKIEPKIKSKKRTQSNEQQEGVIVEETPTKKDAIKEVGSAEKSDLSEPQDVEKVETKKSEERIDPKNRSKKRTQYSEQQDVIEETPKKKDATKEVEATNKSDLNDQQQGDVKKTKTENTEKKIDPKNKSKKRSQSSEQQTEVIVGETSKKKDSTKEVGAANKSDFNHKQKHDIDVGKTHHVEHSENKFEQRLESKNQVQHSEQQEDIVEGTPERKKTSKRVESRTKSRDKVDSSSSDTQKNVDATPKQQERIVAATKVDSKGRHKSREPQDKEKDRKLSKERDVRSSFEKDHKNIDKNAVVDPDDSLSLSSLSFKLKSSEQNSTSDKKNERGVKRSDSRDSTKTKSSDKPTTNSKVINKRHSRDRERDKLVPYNHSESSKSRARSEDKLDKDRTDRYRNQGSSQSSRLRSRSKEFDERKDRHSAKSHKYCNDEKSKKDSDKNKDRSRGSRSLSKSEYVENRTTGSRHYDSSEYLRRSDRHKDDRSSSKSKSLDRKDAARSSSSDRSKSGDRHHTSKESTSKSKKITGCVVVVEKVSPKDHVSNKASDDKPGSNEKDSSNDHRSSSTKNEPKKCLADDNSTADTTDKEEKRPRDVENKLSSGDKNGTKKASTANTKKSGSRSKSKENDKPKDLSKLKTSSSKETEMLSTVETSKSKKRRSTSLDNNEIHPPSKKIKHDHTEGSSADVDENKTSKLTSDQQEPKLSLVSLADVGSAEMRVSYVQLTQSDKDLVDSHFSSAESNIELANRKRPLSKRITQDSVVDQDQQACKVEQKHEGSRLSEGNSESVGPHVVEQTHSKLQLNQDSVTPENTASVNSTRIEMQQDHDKVDLVESRMNTTKDVREKTRSKKSTKKTTEVKCSDSNEAGSSDFKQLEEHTKAIDSSCEKTRPKKSTGVKCADSDEAGSSDFKQLGERTKASDNLMNVDRTSVESCVVTNETSEETPDSTEPQQSADSKSLDIEIDSAVGNLEPGSAQLSVVGNETEISHSICDESQQQQAMSSGDKTTVEPSLRENEEPENEPDSDMAETHPDKSQIDVEMPELISEIAVPTPKQVTQSDSSGVVPEYSDADMTEKPQLMREKPLPSDKDNSDNQHINASNETSEIDSRSEVLISSIEDSNIAPAQSSHETTLADKSAAPELPPPSSSGDSIEPCQALCETASIDTSKTLEQPTSNTGDSQQPSQALCETTPTEKSGALEPPPSSSSDSIEQCQASYETIPIESSKTLELLPPGSSNDSQEPSQALCETTPTEKSGAPELPPPSSSGDSIEPCQASYETTPIESSKTLELLPPGSSDDSQEPPQALCEAAPVDKSKTQELPPSTTDDSTEPSQALSDETTTELSCVDKAREGELLSDSFNDSLEQSAEVPTTAELPSVCKSDSLDGPAEPPSQCHETTAELPSVEEITAPELSTSTSSFDESVELSSSQALCHASGTTELSSSVCESDATELPPAVNSSSDASHAEPLPQDVDETQTLSHDTASGTKAADLPIARDSTDVPAEQCPVTCAELPTVIEKSGTDELQPLSPSSEGQTRSSQVELDDQSFLSANQIQTFDMSSSNAQFPSPTKLFHHHPHGVVVTSESIFHNGTFTTTSFNNTVVEGGLALPGLSSRSSGGSSKTTTGDDQQMTSLSYDMMSQSMNIEDISPEKLRLVGGSTQSLDLLSPAGSMIADLVPASVNYHHHHHHHGRQQANKFFEIKIEKEPNGDHNYSLGGPLVGGSSPNPLNSNAVGDVASTVDKSIFRTESGLSSPDGTTSTEEFQLMSENEFAFISECELIMGQKEKPEDFDNNTRFEMIMGTDDLAEKAHDLTQTNDLGLLTVSDMSGYQSETHNSGSSSLAEPSTSTTSATTTPGNNMAVVDEADVDRIQAANTYAVHMLLNNIIRDNVGGVASLADISNLNIEHMNFMEDTTSSTMTSDVSYKDGCCGGEDSLDGTSLVVEPEQQTQDGVSVVSVALLDGSTTSIQLDTSSRYAAEATPQNTPPTSSAEPSIKEEASPSQPSEHNDIDPIVIEEPPTLQSLVALETSESTSTLSSQKKAATNVCELSANNNSSDQEGTQQKVVVERIEQCQQNVNSIMYEDIKIDLLHRDPELPKNDKKRCENNSSSSEKKKTNEDSTKSTSNSTKSVGNTGSKPTSRPPNKDQIPTEFLRRKHTRTKVIPPPKARKEHMSHQAKSDVALSPTTLSAVAAVKEAHSQNVNNDSVKSSGPLSLLLLKNDCENEDRRRNSRRSSSHNKYNKIRLRTGGLFQKAEVHYVQQSNDINLASEITLPFEPSPPGNSEPPPLIVSLPMPEIALLISDSSNCSTSSSVVTNTTKTHKDQSKTSPPAGNVSSVEDDRKNNDGNSETKNVTSHTDVTEKRDSHQDDHHRTSRSASGTDNKNKSHSTTTTTDRSNSTSSRKRRTPSENGPTDHRSGGSSGSNYHSTTKKPRIADDEDLSGAISHRRRSLEGNSANKKSEIAQRRSLERSSTNSNKSEIPRRHSLERSSTNNKTVSGSSSNHCSSGKNPRQQSSNKAPSDEENLCQESTHRKPKAVPENASSRSTNQKSTNGGNKNHKAPSLGNNNNNNMKKRCSDDDEDSLLEVPPKRSPQYYESVFDQLVKQPPVNKLFKPAAIETTRAPPVMDRYKIPLKRENGYHHDSGNASSGSVPSYNNNKPSSSYHHINSSQHGHGRRSSSNPTSQSYSGNNKTNKDDTTKSSSSSNATANSSVTTHFRSQHHKILTFDSNPSLAASSHHPSSSSHYSSRSSARGNSAASHNSSNNNSNHGISGDRRDSTTTPTSKRYSSSGGNTSGYHSSSHNSSGGSGSLDHRLDYGTGSKRYPSSNHSSGGSMGSSSSSHHHSNNHQRPSSSQGTYSGGTVAHGSSSGGSGHHGGNVAHHGGERRHHSERRHHADPIDPRLQPRYAASPSPSSTNCNSNDESDSEWYAKMSKSVLCYFGEQLPLFEKPENKF